MRNAILVLGVVGLLGLGACAPVLHPVQVRHHLVDGRTGAALSDADLVARLRAARVVIVGEEHSNPQHHGAQLELVTLALATQPQLGLGIEMLPKQAQDVVDRWLSDGDRHELEAAWTKLWGFPFGFYAPMLQAMKDAHRPVFALNAPSSLTRQIARKGLVSLDDAQRAQMPEIVAGPESHRAFVKDALTVGHGHVLDDATFERYYLAQLVWDETMAANAVAAGVPLVILAGGGHARRDAIAVRIQRRGTGPVLTVMPVTQKELPAALAAGQTDVLWVLGRR